MKEIDIKNIEPLQLFKLLYQHCRPVKKWIRANSGSKDDADDTLQDAMIAFYQMVHKQDFVLTVQPQTLLFGIAKKLWLHQLRKNNRFPLSELMEDTLLREEDTDEIEQENKFKLMEKSLVLLGDKCLAILELYYFRKFDMDRIATELGFRNDKVAKAMKYKCLEKARILIHTKNNKQI